MPAFLTHYAFGVQGYHALKRGPLKAAISRHTNVYNLGLAGPDLFFYSVGEFMTRGMTVGRIMHKYRTGAFLRTLYEECMKLTGDARSCALAYYAGFVGHYSLDSNAHHQIYRICDDYDQRKALGRHFRYEAAMDGFCCKNVLGRPISRSHQMGLIRIGSDEQHVIAGILAPAIRKTYPDLGKNRSRKKIYGILKEYYLISGMLIDPSGFKEWLVYQAERRVFGYPLLSPLCINSNTYGLKQEDWECFEKRFACGERMFETLLPMLQEVLTGEVREEQFFDRLGSWSYHGFYHEEAACDDPLRDLEAVTYRREREGHIIP